MNQWIDRFLSPLKARLDAIEVSNPQQALAICQLIPGQCPFERTIAIGDRVLVRIPPLCKLNPVYEELVALRFRAACYLVDSCDMDFAALP